MAIKLMNAIANLVTTGFIFIFPFGKKEGKEIILCLGFI